MDLFERLAQAKKINRKLEEIVRIVLGAVEASGRQALSAANQHSGRDSGKEKEARRLFDLFHLRQFASSRTASLPYGICKLVELARGVGTEAKMLLLDEPAAVLNTAEKEHLAMILRRIIEEFHLSVLLVEHDMSMVEALADQVYVLDAGRCIAQGSFTEIALDPEAVRAYLGKAWSHTQPC